MSDYPTADQFYALADMHARYKSAFNDEWLIRLAGVGRKPPHRDDLIAIGIEASDRAFDSAATQQAMVAYQWLNSQPSFILAKEAVGFTVSSSLKIAERAISAMEERLDPKTAEVRHYQGALERRFTFFQEYISGVARCSANYISGRSVKTALEVPETLARMQSLTSELQQLISATDWFWGDKQKIMERHLARVSHHLDEMSTTPPSRRRDASLPARLMASELIQLHHKVFWRPHNRAVFQLMGLPFIEVQMEMRTIERLAKAERERRKAERERYQARLARNKAADGPPANP